MFLLSIAYLNNNYYNKVEVVKSIIAYLVEFIDINNLDDPLLI